MTDKLTENLKSINIKLNTFFSEAYNGNVSNVQKESTTTTTNNTIHHIHHNSSPSFNTFPLFYGLPYNNHTTIVNNNIATPNNKLFVCKEKEEKDDKDPQSTIGGIAIIGMMATVGTYIISTDEYTNYGNSEIEQDFATLKNDTIKLGKPDITYKLLQLDETFNKWKTMFIDRTYTKRNAKITGTLSGLTIGSGLFLGSTVCMTGGAFGIIASSCYFTWDYYTKYKKIIQEKELFDKIFNDINDAQSMIEEYNLQTIIHSNEKQSNSIYKSPIYTQYQYTNPLGTNLSPDQTYQTQLKCPIPTYQTQLKCPIPTYQTPPDLHSSQIYQTQPNIQQSNYNVPVFAYPPQQTNYNSPVFTYPNSNYQAYQTTQQNIYSNPINNM